MQNRFENRSPDELRPIILTPNFSRNAEGSCLVEYGNTKVLCTASVQTKVPSFLRNSGKGWVTAEYGMLPRSTNTRNNREAARGKQTGRTQEIQRLIGRSLRACCDLRLLGERQIIIDCDVLEADGGTRTASITGGYMALYFACQDLLGNRDIRKSPILSQIVAVSCGIKSGTALLDLDYSEDSTACVDANFVMTDNGDNGRNLIEIQSTAEGNPFSEKEFSAMLSLAKKGANELLIKQREILKKLNIKN